MQRNFRLILALAMLFATAQASATEGAGVLRPSASTGAVHLSEVGGDADLLRLLSIERGKSVLVKTSYQVKRVSVGDPELVDVAVLSPREIQLVAKEVGATNVLVWDSKGRPQASIEVEVGNTQTYLQNELRRILGNDGIQIDSAGPATIVRGDVADSLAAEQAMSVAHAFISGDKNAKVVNLLRVGGHQQVMLKVVIAEMSRTTTREFGTNFNALIDTGSGKLALSGLLGNLTAPNGAGPVLLTDAVNVAAGYSSFGALEQLGVFLDILDERGLTKVLAEPTLVARSGETANFLVGGEVPIPIAQGGAFGSITVEYKHFGVGLDFTPTVMSGDRIHLKVRPEVSQPDFTFGTEVDGTAVPAFNTRTATTSVEMQHGQTLMIAGLLNEEMREQVSQYPILGQIPLLGGLFRSSRYEKNETELVILVTPELVKPLGSDPVALPTDSFIDPSAAEFYLYGWLEGQPPVEDEPSGLIGEAGYRISSDAKGDSNE